MSFPTHKNLLKDFLNPVFIETGTLNGDGLKTAVAAGFQTLMSVDIDPEVVAAVRPRFPNATIVCGDSPKMLPQMIRQAGDQAITFWLDAHYRKSPIVEELDAIKRHSDGRHTILIDDVRLFVAEYGFTVCDIVKWLQEINPNYSMLLVDGFVPGDILAAVPCLPMRTWTPIAPSEIP